MRVEPTDSPLVDELTRPIGRGEHVVRPGECISSIAHASGHFMGTIWDHPANAELRRARVDPYVLLPGDRVMVPPLRDKSVPAATGRSHVFRRRGIPERLRLRLLDEDEPRADEPYILVVDGETMEGTTTADGWIEVWISAQARSATLYVADEVRELSLGQLDPANSRSGAIARLTNLGFLFTGEEDEEAYRAALSVFQQRQGLDVTASLDAATSDALEKSYRAWAGDAP